MRAALKFLCLLFSLYVAVRVSMTVGMGDGLSVDRICMSIGFAVIACGAVRGLLRRD